MKNWVEVIKVLWCVCADCIETYWGDAVAVKPLLDFLGREVTSCTRKDRIRKVILNEFDEERNHN